MSDYITALEAFRDLLETRNEEGLYQAFDRARLYRDSFIGASITREAATTWGRWLTAAVT